MKFSANIIVAVLFLAGYLMVGSNVVFACTCSLPDPAKSLRKQVTEARNESRAVFVGEVVAVSSDPNALAVEVKFKVQRSWKGSRASEITITTGRGGGDCGYRFEIGQRYLVYASGTEKQLGTNICQRTAHLDDAKDDLKLLGKPKWIATPSALIQIAFTAGPQWARG